MRGVRHIVFYSLPQYEEFYSELVNMLSDEDHSGNNDNVASYSELTCTVLFTQYERMALERIVGKKRCDYIFSSKKMAFMFCWNSFLTVIVVTLDYIQYIGIVFSYSLKNNYFE